MQHERELSRETIRAALDALAAQAEATAKRAESLVRPAAREAAREAAQRAARAEADLRELLRWSDEGGVSPLMARRTYYMGATTPKPCDVCGKPDCPTPIDVDADHDASKRFCEYPGCHVHADRADMEQIGEGWYCSEHR